MTRVASALALCLWSAAAPAAAQQTHLVIVGGLSGDQEHADAFHRWATVLIDAAKDRYGVPDGNIVYLAEKPDRDPARIRGRSTREHVEQAFAELAARARPDDKVLVVLIGHGSSDGRQTRFNLPGPDLTAADFARLVDRLPAKHVAFANTASASAGFVAALAAPGRAVVSATRSDAERYDTLFGGFFASAFAADEADVDKNGRISVLEAFNYARGQVATAYEREGLLQTEHAVLDDNGDGKPSAEPSAQAADGQVAAAFHLDAAGRGRAAEAALPADPALRALYLERQALEERIEALKLLKAGMDPARYAQELETLLVELATKTRAIRQIEGKKD